MVSNSQPSSRSGRTAPTMYPIVDHGFNIYLVRHGKCRFSGSVPGVIRHGCESPVQYKVYNKGKRFLQNF